MCLRVPKWGGLAAAFRGQHEPQFWEEKGVLFLQHLGGGIVFGKPDYPGL